MSFANVLPAANPLASSNFNFGIAHNSAFSPAFMSNVGNTNNNFNVNSNAGFGFGGFNNFGAQSNPWATVTATATPTAPSFTVPSSSDFGSRSTKRARETTADEEDNSYKRRVLQQTSFNLQNTYNNNPVQFNNVTNANIPINCNFGFSYATPLAAPSTTENEVALQNIAQPLLRDKYLPPIEPDTIELQEVQPGAIILHPDYSQQPTNNARGHKTRRTEIESIVDDETSLGKKTKSISPSEFVPVSSYMFNDVEFYNDEHPLRSITADNRLTVKPSWSEDKSKAIIIFTPSSSEAEAEEEETDRMDM